VGLHPPVERRHDGALVADERHPTQVEHGCGFG
jgi:hypothetical protein